MIECAVPSLVDAWDNFILAHPAGYTVSPKTLRRCNPLDRNHYADYRTVLRAQRPGLIVCIAMVEDNPLFVISIEGEAKDTRAVKELLREFDQWPAIQISSDRFAIVGASYDLPDDWPPGVQAFTRDTIVDFSIFLGAFTEQHFGSQPFHGGGADG